MYLRRRVAFSPLPAPSLKPILSELIAVDECLEPHYVYAATTLPPGVVVIRHTVSGQVEVEAGGRVQTLGPGSVTVYGEGLTYRQTVGRSPWSVRYLIARGAWATPLLDRLGADAMQRLNAAAGPVAARLADAVAAALDLPPGWDWRCAASLAAITELVLHGDGLAPGLAGTVAGLLDTAPDRAWTTTGLARTLGLPLSTLAHRFPVETGKPLARWMRERRLARARLLLQQGLSVSAVAERMRFSSPFQLSRAYKAWAGHPPSEDVPLIPSELTTSGSGARR
jgi:AraC-like DNA-binding protein